MTTEPLNEMPMLHPEVLDSSVGEGKKFGDVSPEALEREFVHWKTLSNGGIAVKLYRKKLGTNKPGKTIYGFMEVKRGKKSMNAAVFFLQFYKELEFEGSERFKKAVQVKMVQSADFIQSFGLASQVYAALCKEGYTVISDNAQYIGGMKLWKRIITDAQANGLKVSVYDEMEEAEEPYDASKDSEYWTTDSDGMFKLLVLRSR